MSEVNWEALSAPFPAEAINQKPKKNKDGSVTWLDYLGHAEVTERLNQVDPAWTYEPYSIAEDGCPLIRTSADGRTAELWINLVIGGVSRPGVGTCSTEAYSGEVAKELVSDALRNAAMRFGVGLDLWKRHVSAAPAGQENQYPAATNRWPENPPANAAQDAPPNLPRTQGPGEQKLTEGQSKMLFRLQKKLKLDKVEYVDAILIATGREDVMDDRTLSMSDASKVIVYLKEQAGEPVDTKPAFNPEPPPDDSLFGGGMEPF